MKNKKADIPVMVLVIGVFAICCLAILSFVKIEGDIKESFESIELIEKLNSEMERYFFYKNLPALISNDKINEYLNIKTRNDNTGKEERYIDVGKEQGRTEGEVYVRYYLP